MWSSTFSTVIGSPLTDHNGSIAGVSSLFFSTSSYQNMTSSAVNGWPSDHFIPWRSLKVKVVASSLIVNDSATCGSTALQSRFQRTRLW